MSSGTQPVLVERRRVGFMLGYPGRVVEVRHKGVWLHGLLRAYWRQDGRWHAYVEFSHPDGVTQPKVFDQDEVRSGRP